MKKIILLFILLFVSGSVEAAGPYYVRPNGGTGSQCTGLVDQDYDAGAHGTSCALNHPFWLTGVHADCGNTSGVLAAGETAIIYPKSGGYDMGYGAPNTAGSTSFPWDCHMKPIPSGPNSSTKTKIYGSNYADCSDISDATELYGKERSYWVIDLQGSSNVDLRCIHVTDHSQCRYNSTLSDGDACSTSYPYGDFAQKGIKSASSANINLENFWVTGMASEGASIANPSDWTLTNVNIIGNAQINYNFNGTGSEGTTDEATGTMSFSGGTVAWGGCTLKYPVTYSSYDGITLPDPRRCCSQDQGCASDGLGSQSNQATWIFDGVKFVRNVADGLDLLYHDVDGGTGTVTIKNSKFIKNSGNQVKSGGNSFLSNLAIDADCMYFNGKSYTWTSDGGFSDNCRAAGNALSFAYQTGTDVYLEGVTVLNTVNAEPITVTSRNISACDSSNKLQIKNSIFKTTNGLNWIDKSYEAGVKDCRFLTDTQDHSVITGFASNPSGTGNVYTDPGLSGTILGSDQNFLIPNTGSSAYNIADESAANQTSNDMFGYARGAAWDAGAIEFGSTDTDGGGGGSSNPPTVLMGEARMKLGEAKIPL